MRDQVIENLSAGVGLVLRTGRYRELVTVLAVGLSFMYMILLPSLIIGSITLDALRYITPVELMFSVLMGPMLSLVMAMNVYALRMSKACSRKTVTLSLVASILPNGLCCTTVIPTVIGLLAVSSSVVFTVSPTIQAFISRYAVVFYFASLLSLLYSMQLISKDIARKGLVAS